MVGRPAFYARLRIPVANAGGVERLLDYLTQLASPSPTPGGGSAATIVAAMGAALVAMAARITAANPKYAAKHTLAQRIAARADALRAELLTARSRDEAAFAAVLASRGDARQLALQRAAAEPLRSARLALEVEQVASQALELENPHLASDLGCATEFAAAALAACAYNVRVNHRSMHDAQAVTAQTAEMERYERESATLLQRVRERVR